jgi:tetratricopeptide (TPR) repeat protein
VTWLALRHGDEALRDLSESAATLSRIFGPSHEETLIAKYNWALALAYLGRTSEAEAVVAPIAARYRSTYLDLVYKPYRPIYVSGVVKRLAGDPEAALATQQQALALVENDRMTPWERMPIVAEIGLSQVDLKRYDQAITSLEQARSLFRKLQVRMTPVHAETLVGLGRAKMAQGKVAEAMSLFEEADRFWRGFDPENRWAGEAAFWASKCYRTEGLSENAVQAFRRARRILARSPIASDARLLRITDHGCRVATSSLVSFPETL